MENNFQIAAIKSTQITDLFGLEEQALTGIGGSQNDSENKTRLSL